MSALINKIINFIRPKRDLTSFHSILGNPFVWVAITLIILLISYLTLKQPSSQITGSEKPTQNSSASTKTFNKVRIDAPKRTQLNLSDDAERAQNFRAQDTVEAYLEKWFTQAEELLAAGQFVEPEEYNAWFAYQKVLLIDPDNHKAIAGLGEIETRLYAKIENAYANDNFAETEFWLNKFAVIHPNDPFINAVKEQIQKRQAEIKAEQEEKALAQQKQEKIESIRAEIQQMLENPPYSVDKLQALYIDLKALYPSETIPDEAIEPIIVNKLALIQRFINDKEFDAASENLASLSKIAPDDPRVAAMPNMIKLAQEAEKKRQESELARANAILNAQDKIEENNENLSTSSQNNVSTPAPANTPPNTNDVPINDALNNSEVFIQDKSIVRSDAEQLRDAMQAFYLEDDYPKAAKLFAPLARNNHIRAQFYLGLIDRYIANTEIENSLAQTWINSATLQLLEQAHRGVASAQFDVGLAYQYGISFRRDNELAEQWYTKARAQGYSLDNNQLSRFFPTQSIETKR